jgi:hypothetical protein
VIAEFPDDAHRAPLQARIVSQNFFRRSQTAVTIQSMNSDERPPRLKRLDRLFTSHPLYFVTTNTEDHKLILANAKVHGDFRKFCGAGLTRGVFVGKYVLMPDHLHLFVAFE